MKTEDLKAQGLTDEQIKFVMKENGIGLAALQQEVSTLKSEKAALETDKTTLQTTLQNTQQKLDGFIQDQAVI